jgi:hypothetical protein
MSNQIIQGILLGGYYALIACGLSFMFSVMRIINLAHGSLAVFAAYARGCWPRGSMSRRLSACSSCCHRWRRSAGRCSASCSNAARAAVHCCRS